MFFTLGSSCTPRCTACGTMRETTSTDTWPTPGTVRAAASSAAVSDGTRLFAG